LGDDHCNVGYTKATLDQNVTGTASVTTGIAPVLGHQQRFVLRARLDGGRCARSQPLPWYGLNGSLRVDYQYSGKYTRTPAGFRPCIMRSIFRAMPMNWSTARACKDAWTLSGPAKNLTNAYPTPYKARSRGGEHLPDDLDTGAAHGRVNFTYRW
jgi:hypothetical protein